MNESESTEQVTDALWDKVNYLVKEYTITTARMIGILEMIKYELITEEEENE